MFTQKKTLDSVIAAQGPAKPPMKGEILIEGFVPTRQPQDRFDIGGTYREVAMYLREKGFLVEGCADFTGVEFHGGDLSGARWNACQFDVFTDSHDKLQARLSIALRMVTDTRDFRAMLRASVDGVGTIVFNNGETTPQDCLSYLMLIENAAPVEVKYLYDGRNGRFEI